jgi:recombination protein RecA
VATEKSNKANDAAQDKANSERQKALDTALAQIERQFGKGSVIKMSERQAHSYRSYSNRFNRTRYRTWNRRHFHVVALLKFMGQKALGKTTLTLPCNRKCSKAGGICAFIDAEHAFDAEYAKKLGVDIDALLVSQPDTGEQALEIMDMLDSLRCT